MYESQLDYIKKTGNYIWHNQVRPCPTYIKNKYNIIADIQPDVRRKNFINKVQNINNMYETKLQSYRDYLDFRNSHSKIVQDNRMFKLRQAGKQVFDSDRLQLEKFYTQYGKEKRLNPKFDNYPISIIDNHYKIFPVFKLDTSRLSVEQVIPF